MNRYLFPPIGLSIAIFFILLGVGVAIIPWAPEFRSLLVDWVNTSTITPLLIGIGFCLIGYLLLSNLLLHRRHYYSIKIGHQAVAISESLIQDYLKSYWQDLFPNLEVSSQIVFKRNKLRIIADFPPIPRSAQKELLERIQRDLSSLFQGTLGYSHEFILAASFRPEEKINPKIPSEHSS